MAAEKVQRGLQQIVLLRLGAYWTGKRLAVCGLISEEYRTQCPMCGQPEGEDVAHLLLRCPAWEEVRDQFLGTVLESISQLADQTMEASFTDSQTVTLLLGGEVVKNRLRNWCFTHAMEDSADIESEGPSVEGGTDLTVEGECASLRQARFLNAVTQERSSVIRSLGQGPQDPPTALGQSPDG